MAEDMGFDLLIGIVSNPACLATVGFLLYAFGVRRSELIDGNEDSYSFQKNLFRGFEFFRDSLFLPLIVGIYVPLYVDISSFLNLIQVVLALFFFLLLFVRHSIIEAMVNPKKHKKKSSFTTKNQLVVETTLFIIYSLGFVVLGHQLLIEKNLFNASIPLFVVLINLDTGAIISQLVIHAQVENIRNKKT
jgi:hypothetical protein